MRKLMLYALLAFVSVPATAQMEGMQPVIASDGTVLVVRPLMTSDYRATTELVAISANGVALWKWEGGAMMHTVTVSGNRVFVTRNTGAAAEEVTALSLANGAVQWRRELQGGVSGLQASGDRLYVVSGMTGSGMYPGMPQRGRVVRPWTNEVTLTVLDVATGTVLWTVVLK